MFLLLLLLFLLPIAVYCIALAVVNRRPHPAMLSGAWDFLGLLFAASGLLLYTAPTLLDQFFRQRADELAFAAEGPSPAAVGNLVSWWWVAWYGYYALVLGSGAFLVWWRRHKTVIYNIAPADLDRALAQALARLGLDASHTGNRRYIGFGGGPAARPDATASPFLTAVSAAPGGNGDPAIHAPEVRPPSGEAVLDVEPFPTLWNVTLHWRSDSGTVRREVEAELAKDLKEVRTYDNPVGTWFLGTAGFLFALTFMVVLVLFLRAVVPPGR